ncbi:hypothetical protein [Mycolicibacterium porcinum]|uniref:hypothetical protein n=1 Tax=Mycolicibacterium porcinum TaxID=39693 RepID=UPI001645CF53|nr:hypothetical protein [Mycolicibacterium porcinum]
MSEYFALAKRWTEVAKLVAAGSWHGIRCPKNADADVLLEKRSWVSETDPTEKRYEYWIHCPNCGADIFFQSKDEYGPDRDAGAD